MSIKIFCLASTSVILLAVAVFMAIGLIIHKRRSQERRVRTDDSILTYSPVPKADWDSWPRNKKEQARNLMVEKVCCQLRIANFEKLVRQLFPGQGNRAESIIEDCKGSQVRERIRAAMRDWINRNKAPEELTNALRNIDENVLAEQIDSEIVNFVPSSPNNNIA